MAMITGVNQLRARFVKERRLVEGETNIEVGYSTPYAIYVHENLRARHVVGQAKFIEAPARVYARTAHLIVAKELMRGKNWLKAMMTLANILYERSQELVPVDTGLLRSTGFVRSALTSAQITLRKISSNV